MFNKKMLKVKELIKPMTFEALMGGVKGKALWKELYALLNRSFLKVKQSMKNHIRVEKQVYCVMVLPIFLGKSY